MSKIEGVSYYTTGYVNIPVHFPENKVSCQWCPYIRYDDGLKRHLCRFTFEFLPYWNTGIGNQCPIDFKEDDKNV